MRPGIHPAQSGHLDHAYREAHVDGMHIRYNVPVPMRDGVEILADVFLPEGATDVPPIVGWGAYGKHRVPGRYPPGADVDPSWVSRHAIFEAPDPAYWTAHGYGVVFVDPRGTWYSGGVMRGFQSRGEGEDIHDLIEWLAVQPWSNGRVGMSGVSYYAIAQWFAAATRPPHLAAINPWEGFTDRYRDTVYHGGIREVGSQDLWWDALVPHSVVETEDGVRMIDEHPLFDAYWEDNSVALERIEVPAYVVASWSDQGLHTRGTLEGFRRISSRQKWLEVHGQKKWEYQFRPENVERLRVFFDHFLRGASDEVLEWPAVRIEVRDRAGAGVWRDEAEWPLERTRYTRLYLDAAAGKMSPEEPRVAASVSYDSEARHDAAYFTHIFAADTELTGHMRLRLWVEAPDADDADLFVAIDKLDRDGRRVDFVFYSLFEDGPVALGWQRASHRELDPARTTEHQPVHTHRAQERLRPGEIVPVDIEIWPSSTSFAAGEAIRVRVQGGDTVNDYPEGTIMMRHRDLNRGRHVLHTGPGHDAYLLVPEIPPTDRTSTPEERPA